jgi:CRISPR-associated protein Csb2
MSGDARPVFSGHSQGGPSNHGHAMYLASSVAPENADRGLVDELIVSARAGFDPEDVLALQGIRRLWGRGGHDLELVLVGLGTATDYGGSRAPRVPVLAETSTWRSLTPFVPTRHPKMVRGMEVDSIGDQLRRACVQFLGVAPVDVAPFGEQATWVGFRRRRARGGGRRGPDRAVGARLVFAEPVRGPIAIGYGAHLGLGLFTPDL